MRLKTDTNHTRRQSSINSIHGRCQDTVYHGTVCLVLIDRATGRTPTSVVSTIPQMVTLTCLVFIGPKWHISSQQSAISAEE